MGIHPNHPELSTTVFVNDELAEECPHDELESSDRTITKYVEAISEAYFGINIIVPAKLFAQYSVWVKIRIDGEEVCTKLLRKHKHDQFGSVNDIFLKESSRVPDSISPQQIADLGTISVLFYLVTDVVSQPPRVRHSQVKLPSFASLPEKALEGSSVSHTVHLGPSQQGAPSTHSLHCNYVDGKQHPFAVFHFKYRSMGKSDTITPSTESLLVVPRTPSPETAKKPTGARLGKQHHNSSTHSMQTRGAAQRPKREEVSKVEKGDGVKVRQEQDGNNAIEDGDEPVVIKKRAVRSWSLPQDDEVIALD
ncbi:hypothetical protein E8E11_004603 [Didymella keratinophila]|nr:hypothetical protein E8E11_004603 [Didymella keratinophila]